VKIALDLKSWNTRGLIFVGVLMLALLFAGPQVFDLFVLLKVILFVSTAMLALSMAFIWGFGGILCFGQSAFFGIGAYAYAIGVINIGESTVPILLSVLVPAAFAMLLGYFMFYGRLSDIYLAVVTLAVTLIFYAFMRSTSGEEYRIGNARLMGFNGISSIPEFNWPGYPNSPLWPDDIFYVATTLLILVYFGLRILLRSHFGRVVVAIKENETRAEYLGYDVRFYKTIAFSIGAGIAGLAGCLFVSFNNFINPDVFALGLAAQIIMWVLIGGVGTLVGPMLGSLGLQMLYNWLGTQSFVSFLNTYLVFGAIIIIFVLAVPQGLQPTARLLALRFLPFTRPPEEADVAARAKAAGDD
jgi:branched-chain amino acid transport system permease protein